MQILKLQFLFVLAFFMGSYYHSLDIFPRRIDTVYTKVYTEKKNGCYDYSLHISSTFCTTQYCAFHRSCLKPYFAKVH